MRNYDKARAIRESHPWIPLCDALAYADPASPFNSQGDGFFGFGVPRWDLMTAHAWHATLWGPNDSNRVANRVSLGCCAKLETETEEVKRAYGEIVRKNHRLMVGFERLYKRNPDLAKPWPGTRNIPGGDSYRYLASRGLLNAVESYVP